MHALGVARGFSMNIWKPSINDRQYAMKKSQIDEPMLNVFSNMKGALK